jgi:indolepyruvate ferredoxin oxidoreductase
MSHVQIAPHPQQIHATRIATAEAHVLIGCDEIVTASNDVLSRVQAGLTRGVVNTALTPAAEFLSNPDWTFPTDTAEAKIQSALAQACEYLDATALSTAVLGDSIFANPLLLGYAWQRGWIPLGYAALRRAIELNGTAVAKNLDAFEWGRVAAWDASRLPQVAADNRGAPACTSGVQHFDPAGTALSAAAPVSVETGTLAQVIAAGEQLLSAYQNNAYARRYRQAVDKAAAIEQTLGLVQGSPLTMAVARNLSKLMAYKDEFEVARLYAAPAFREQLNAQFAGEPGRDYQLNFYLAPPLLASKDARGHLRKQRFGHWMWPAVKILAKFRGLRGTVLDIFGYTAERRQERQLIADYLAMLDEFSRSLNRDRLTSALELAQLPQAIRGYGHVKEKSMAEAAAKREQLWQEYHRTV